MSRSYSVWLVSLGFALHLLLHPLSLSAAGVGVLRVAPDVYVIPGEVGEATAENRGRVVNTGFIVGIDGVVVIDSGASHAQGEAILAEIAGVTDRPVRLLINTHPHPQNVLGNSAFAARGIPILASVQTRALMDERCPRCFDSMSKSIGVANMAGTRIVLPGVLVSGSETRRIAGRELRLLHLSHAHSEGDLAVLDVATGTLFAGDVVYHGQLPHLGEADVGGWIAALAHLQRETFSVLVPGRGAPGGHAELAAFAEYLQELRDRVGDAYAAGRTPDETLELVRQPAFAGWEGHATRQGRNVQHIYFEFERADLAGGERRR